MIAIYDTVYLVYGSLYDTGMYRYLIYTTPCRLKIPDSRANWRAVLPFVSENESDKGGQNLLSLSLCMCHAKKVSRQQCVCHPV